MDSSNSSSKERRELAKLIAEYQAAESQQAKERPPYVSILTEADKAVNGERQENYGSQSTNFQNIADIWRVILGIPITPQQVAMCMAGLKLARLIKTNGHHRDSIVDIAGYAECLQKINEGY